MRHTLVFPLAALALAGCSPKPPEPPPAPPAATVDQAAIKTALDSVRARYMRLQTAGDAVGVAALYTPDGVIDFFGAPRMQGRAGIEAGLRGAYSMQKPVVLEIVAANTRAPNATTAAEIGTYHEMDSVKGKMFHGWGRYVMSAAKDSTGAWKLSYLMAFPDSTRTDK